MSDNRCPYCLTLYTGDMDEAGKPLCQCNGSDLARLLGANNLLKLDNERLRDRIEILENVLLGAMKIVNEYYAFGLEGFDHEYRRAKDTVKTIKRN